MWWHLPLIAAVLLSPCFSLCKMLKRKFKRRSEVQEHSLNDLYGALWDETDEKVEHYTELLCRPKWYCYWDAMSRKDVESRVHEFRAHQSRIGGVSLRYVLSNEFAQLARRRTGQTNPTFNEMKEAFWLGQYPIGKDIVCPRDGMPGCAMVDWIPRPDRRKQTHFMSWTWKYTLGQLHSALEMFKMNTTPPRDTSSIFFYISFFVNNQFRIIVDGVAAGSDDLENSFKVNLSRSGRMVAVLDTWEDPVYLKRVWTVYEQFVACSSRLPVEFVMPDASMASLQDHIRQGERGLKKVTASICKVDSEKAEAWKAEDEKKVKAAIRDLVGFEEVNQHVRNALVDWIGQAVRKQFQELVDAAI